MRPLVGDVTFSESGLASLPVYGLKVASPGNIMRSISASAGSWVRGRQQKCANSDNKISFTTLPGEYYDFSPSSRPTYT
jgi:hypothetical protein